MWVMLNDAWLSIVADREDKDFLLVRSRRRGDVARIFGVDEFEDSKADYHFRAFVHRDHVAGVMAREVEGIDYPNFKNSVKDNELHSAYSNVWTIGFRLQNDADIEGRLRRRRGMMGSSSVDTLDDPWPPLNCESCGVELDHAFHAPVIGQPAGECETCWAKGLHGNYQEDSEEEDGEEEGYTSPLFNCFLASGDVDPLGIGDRRFKVVEGRDEEDFSFEDLEAIEEDDEEAGKVADLFARRQIT